MSPQVQCTFCLEDMPGKLVNVAGDKICHACFSTAIKPMFIDALKYEINFAVTWGAAVLDFKIEWRQKRKEYETPFAERTYCKHRFLSRANPRRALIASGVKTAEEVGDKMRECGRFFGTKAETKGRTLTCLRCFGHTYGTCGEPLARDGDGVHECVKPASASKAEEADPLEGMAKGKDYQKCPSCDCVVGLEDGCNTIVCAMPRCRAHFCFICGEKALHSSDHWAAGKPCPRWNQPGAENAFHDEPLVEQGEGEEQELDIHEIFQELINEAQAGAEAAETEDHRVMYADMALLLQLSLQLGIPDRDPDDAGEEGALMRATMQLFMGVGIYARAEFDNVVYLGVRDILAEEVGKVEPADLERYPQFQEVYGRFLATVVRRLAELEGQ
ncbi:hypothetical protein LTR85_009745 [Meristemomyces frigidus]|nr:hypothetical protein LTR85_009745 [Meristemomyces frigidus]